MKTTEAKELLMKFKRFMGPTNAILWDDCIATFLSHLPSQDSAGDKQGLCNHGDLTIANVLHKYCPRCKGYFPM